MSTLEISRGRIRRKNKKRRSKLFRKTIFAIIISLLIISFYNYNQNQQWENSDYSSELSEEIYDSMQSSDNRLLAYNKAIELNGGKTANTCVYFASEVLRMNGEEVDYSICNTLQLLDVLKEKGWKRNYDYSKLRPGDICFTTDMNINDDGKPTHTYIFMGWVEAGKYDYAYICDNQAKDYDGKIYHIRNVADVDTVDGNTKEPFSFFMYEDKSILF